MKRILTTLLLLPLFYSTKAQHNTYYIGHSGFGWDLIVGEMVNDLATDASISTYSYGFQFNGGTCLTNQWYSHASPQGGTDSWTELQTGNYDFLILAEQIPIQEVIYGSPWCHANQLTSVQAVDSFYSMATNANPNTRVYLMEFHNEVDQTGPTPNATWEALNTSMRPLWEQVVDSVNLLNSGPDICIVPVASAFQTMADSVIDGSFPGETNWINLFDPNDTVVATIHPTEETYYLVACVHYATIFGQSPVGLTNQTFAALGWAFDPPTPAQALMMQQIAWNTVINDPYSCVTITGNTETEPLRLSGRPNPAKDEWTVTIPNGLELEQLTILNEVGQAQNVSFGHTNTEVLVNVSNLNSGVYIYRIGLSNGQTTNGKLVIE